MKISIIDFVGNKSGMDDYSRNLAESIRNLGYDVSVFSNYDGSIQVFKKFLDRSYLKFLYYIVGYSSIFIRSLYLKNNIHIFHLFNFGYKELTYYLLANFFQIRVVTICHDPSPLRGGNFSFIAKYILNIGSFKVVVHNNYSLDALSRIYNYSKNVFIIHHGISFQNISNDIDVFNLENISIPSGGKVLLFFGQLKQAKGLDILFQAFNYLDDSFYIVVAGKDDFGLFDKLIYLVGEKMRNRVIKILRFIEDGERSFLMKTADMVILPYKEIFQSGVLVTAIQFNKPIVASDLRPNLFYKEYYNKIIFFKSGNSQRLVESILIYYSENFFTSNITLGKNLQDLSWASSARKFVSLLKLNHNANTD